MKYLKIGIYELWAGAIIAFAASVRLILTAFGWPITNSDEGTMGIAALHIAYHGEHPFMYYGQNYMGTLEAYIAAALFHIFGPSLFVLRLSVILLVTLFLVSMYLLTSLLYSKRLALLTVAVLSLGSNVILTREIMTTGGSAETLLFGSLAFLLSTWLGLTCRKDPSPQLLQWRMLGYIGWGLVGGLALWSDLIVLPFLAMAALFLLLFCWRDLLSPAPLCLLLGLSIGISPAIIYNLKALRGENSLTILFGLFHGTQTQAPYTLAQIIQGVKGTVLVSIPTATGNPFCPVSEEWQYFRYSSPHSTQCTIVHATWGLGYIILWVLAAFLTLSALLKLCSPSQTSRGFPEERRTTMLRLFGRLMLLGSAALALGVYALSSAPLGWPGIHARYIIGLLIVTPAIIAPLWSGLSKLKQAVGRTAQIRSACSAGALALIGVVLLLGTISTFREVPLAQSINSQQTGLMNSLLRIHATHIYSDYWTCDSLIFESDEKIICAVVDSELHVNLFHNRYQPYMSIVEGDPHAAYVFPIGIPQAANMARKSALPGASYRRFVFDGYAAYLPT